MTHKQIPTILTVNNFKKNCILTIRKKEVDIFKPLTR